MKVFLPGGAGLVGINLIALIKSKNPEWDLVVVDKKLDSIKIAKNLFPDVIFICEDLTITVNQKWVKEIKDCDLCVMLQAEIGTINNHLFELNNITTTSQIIYILVLIIFEILNVDINIQIFHILIGFISLLSLISYFRWWLNNNFIKQNV